MSNKDKSETKIIQGYILGRVLPEGTVDRLLEVGEGRIESERLIELRAKEAIARLLLALHGRVRTERQEQERLIDTLEHASIYSLAIERRVAADITRIWDKHLPPLVSPEGALRLEPVDQIAREELNALAGEWMGVENEQEEYVLWFRTLSLMRLIPRDAAALDAAICELDTEAVDAAIVAQTHVHTERIRRLSVLTIVNDAAESAISVVSGRAAQRSKPRPQSGA